MLEILETLGGYFGCDGGGRADVFFGRRRKQRCYREDASIEEGGDIYNLCPRVRWELGALSVWKMVCLNVGDND